jgi:hypothetical protein
MKSRIVISALFAVVAANAFASDATSSAAQNNPLSAFNKHVYGGGESYPASLRRKNA